MEELFFSVIVPIYNVEEYLEECLESVLFQNYQNYEVICINDASTDNSYKILLGFAQQYNKIKIINNTINRGLSYSRNRGIEVARGEYILFVDSDDYIMKDTLESLANTLQEIPVDILNFNYEMKIESKYVKEKNPVIKNVYKKEILPKSGKKWFIDEFNNSLLTSPYAWTRIYKKSFLTENHLHFYDGLLFEDVLFLVQSLIKAKAVAGIENRLYVYRRRDDSITTIKSEAQLDSFVVILNEISLIRKNSNFDEEMNAALEQYGNKLLPKIWSLMMCFPNHKKLKIGRPEDQSFFDFLQSSNDKDIYQYIDLNQEELKAIQKFDKKIIYGAGTVCAELIYYFQKRGIHIHAIAVSNKSFNVERMAGYTIQQIDELIEYKEDALVIVAVIKRNQEPIKQKLKELGFNNIFLLDTDRRVYREKQDFSWI